MAKDRISIDSFAQGAISEDELFAREVEISRIAGRFSAAAKKAAQAGNTELAARLSSKVDELKKMLRDEDAVDDAGKNDDGSGASAKSGGDGEGQSGSSDGDQKNAGQQDGTQGADQQDTDEQSGTDDKESQGSDKSSTEQSSEEASDKSTAEQDGSESADGDSDQQSSSSDQQNGGQQSGKQQSGGNSNAKTTSTGGSDRQQSKNSSKVDPFAPKVYSSSADDPAEQEVKLKDALREIFSGLSGEAAEGAREAIEDYLVKARRRYVN